MPPTLQSSRTIGSGSCSAAIPRTQFLPVQQVRHATLIRRPKRPYTFTQLITLSDGSSFIHRTTSPAPIYVSTRDTRNTPLWNPSNARMANVEEDEAGRLRAFRRRFGRAFDSAATEPSASQPSAAPENEAASKAQSDAAEGKRERKSESPSPSLDGGVPGASREPSAALKTQDGAAPRGAGAQTTRDSGTSDDEEENDNLMDLLNSYASQDDRGGTARVVQRGGGESTARGKGNKR